MEMYSAVETYFSLKLWIPLIIIGFFLFILLCYCIYSFVDWLKDKIKEKRKKNKMKGGSHE